MVIILLAEHWEHSSRVDSKLKTDSQLDQHCLAFNISAELRPELPDRNSTIKDSPEGKIGMYTRFIEFANYRVSLSKFLLCILEYYQIHLSQLFMIGAAKVSHFEIMCRDLGCIPTVVDEAVDLPCVELLNENRTLIRKYLETFLCFVGLSRSFTDIDVRPTLLRDNDEEMGLLDFVKSADPFKVKVGERTLAKNEVPADTLKLEDRKKRVAFVSGSPPVKKAQTGGIVISEPRPSTAGKSPTALQRLIRQGEQAAAGSRSAAAGTEDITSFSITPTPEHVLDDALHDNVRTRPATGRFVVLSSSSADTDIPAATKFAGDGHPALALEFESGTLSATPSHGSSADDFHKSQTVDSATAINVYVPNWNVTNNGRLDDPIICRSLLDNVTPPGYWVALRNQSDVGFLNAFNINSAQHICMATELRLRYEHEIMAREKFEKIFIDSDAVIQQRDAEIVELKVKLEKSGSEAAEVEELRKHVSDLEALVAVKSDEIANLTAQNAGLLQKREEFVLQQDAAELDACIADVRRDMDNDLFPHMLTVIAGRRWVVGHGFRLAVYKCARSVECRSALGRVISMAINKGIQQGLKAGIVHGKAGRSLAQVEAYDPDVEGKYVSTVSDFEGVSFPLLDELEGLRDSPLAPIMSALILKDDQGNRDATPEFARFQPSIDQFDVPVYSESGSIEREMLLSDAIPAIRQSTERRGLCPPSGSILDEASGFAPLLVITLGVTDYQASTLVLASDGGPANQPPVTQPHDDLFDTSVLDNPRDV
ncbi:hypothetical protein Tco_0647780 [Tanacetum coccineum]